MYVCIVIDFLFLCNCPWCRVVSCVSMCVCLLLSLRGGALVCHVLTLCCCFVSCFYSVLSVVCVCLSCVCVSVPRRLCLCVCLSVCCVCVLCHWPVVCRVLCVCPVPCVLYGGLYVLSALCLCVYLMLCFMYMCVVMCVLVE
ncbi:hypothetical protein FKM82_027394 [Ascaphus truei]